MGLVFDVYFSIYNKETVKLEVWIIILVSYRNGFTIEGKVQDQN